MKAPHPAHARATRGEHGNATHRAIPLLALTIAGVAAATWPVLRQAQPIVLFNPSSSAPRGWYLATSDLPTRRGQFAIAHLPASAATLAAERHYLPRGIALLKSVAALHGDYVCERARQVQINRRIVGAALAEDARHRPLDAWNGCGILTARQYFLLSTISPASFDSRYFGPLDRGLIAGRATPIWTWP